MRARNLYAWFIVVAGCSRGSVAAPDRPTSDLEGVWRGEWTVEKSSVPGVATSRVQGDVALVPAPSQVKRLNIAELSRATHFGVYNADFHALNISIGDSTAIPFAAAQNGGGDSVEVRLSPQSDHGALMMQGTISGDSLLGRWYQPIAGGATGRFIMHRQRGSSSR